MKPYLTLATLIAFTLLFSTQAYGQMVQPHPVPQEFASRQYTVEINGTSVPVFEASPRVHFASFDFEGEVQVKVNGTVRREVGVPLPLRDEQKNGSPIWEGQAVVRPLSRGVEVQTDGSEASFKISRPGQYSVEGKPVSRFATANQDMTLFLFANPPETDRPDLDGENVVHLAPGLHQQNLDLTSGQTLYLEAGAVLFGSVDVYDAKDVKILGRGVVFHYGPHSENNDDGYLRKRDWHPLTTRNVEGLTVEGVTFVARSRTWTIQMHTTFDSVFDNVKVLGVNDQNINGDGFDWVDGGGRSVVRNSLVRTSDDNFAFFTPRGPEPEGVVRDVTVENCVLWPTRANIVRVSGYVEGFTMRDCDVIHVPEGLFSIPRALLCSVRANEEQYLKASNFLYEDIRIEESAAIFGVLWPRGQYRDITFRNVTMAVEPTPSYFDAQSIEDVVFDNVVLGGKPIRERDDLTFGVLDNEIENLRIVGSQDAPEQPSE